MRNRGSATLAAALVLLGAAVASSQGPAAAVVPGVVDAAVTIEGRPQVVSPPGAYVLYEVKASNVGLTDIDAATVDVALPAGSLFDGNLSSDACSGSGVSVSCDAGALAPGSTVRLDVVASTPTTPSTDDGYEAVATITVTSVFEPLEYQDNNRDTTTIHVEEDDGGGVSALVREHESLTLDVGDGRSYTLTVPAGVPGVIVSIDPDDGSDKLCGLTQCGKGFLTEFEPHPVFKAEDPTNPLLTQKTFGPQPPCQGLGGDCTEIYFAKDDLAPVLVEMDECPPSGDASPSPCLHDKFKRDRLTFFDVRMLSNDPLELPPLGLGQ